MRGEKTSRAHGDHSVRCIRRPARTAAAAHSKQGGRRRGETRRLAIAQAQAPMPAHAPGITVPAATPFEL